MYLRVLLVLTLIVSGFVLAGAQPASTDDSKGYLIGPGDEITVKVLGESQFDFVSTVDVDGKIEVPFFDTPINAKCLSERDLRLEVTRLLARFLKSPQLSLRVTGRNSRPPVSVYGEVRQQQQFTLTRRVHLLELISYAGGETEKSGGMIQVFRTRPPMCNEALQADDWKPVGDTVVGVPSKLYSLASMRQGQTDSNPEIFPGDIIVVQKAAPVYVTGEVIRPGELNIPEGGLPLTQAIAMASGPTREAKKKEIKIFRRKDGSSQPEVIAVNYDQIRKGGKDDFMLQAFDIVEVGKSKKSIGEILLEAVTGIPSRLPIPIKPL